MFIKMRKKLRLRLLCVLAAALLCLTCLLLTAVRPAVEQPAPSPEPACAAQAPSGGHWWPPVLLGAAGALMIACGLYLREKDGHTNRGR